MAEVIDETNAPENLAAATEAENSNMSSQDRLADLTAKAMAEYAVKHYPEAAELYSQATELQAEINGEMAVENADLLYSYGKCLYYLAQQTSSVLGGTAASAQLSRGPDQKVVKKRKVAKQPKAATEVNGSGATSELPLPEETVPLANVGDVIPEKVIKSEEQATSDKPLFQITGDENWDDSDDEEGEEEGAEAEGEEEDEDDFANAYELLDLARILYLKKLEQLQEEALDDSNKGKYIASISLTPPVKEVKERVADIYDLQAEVSLEGEKYSAAVTDLKACLALKEELESPESSILAECHYKLSLALEFTGQTQQRDSDGNPVGDLVVDWDIRNEAVAHQEKAIDCCKLRVAKETKALESIEQGKERDKAMAQIEDVQEMIGEMDVRLSELQKPPVSVKAETEMKEQISGVLGSILGGGTAEEQKAKLEKATEGATDIGGLVKRKKPKSAIAADGGGDSGFGSAASTPVASAAEPVAAVPKANGKRKVEFLEETEEMGTGKKAKVEDAEDSDL